MSSQGDSTARPVWGSPFELLPPPATVGFLKLSRPCCYAFPAGHGDCAFFAVNGFTLLLDGGSEPRACFWKLVRHLDRVDALLLTHAGADNLGGVNAFLERKVAETELRAAKDDGSEALISPELGVVFFNAPDGLMKEQQRPCVDNVAKSPDQAALTVQLLKKLDIRPHPMFRPPSGPPEPITLFQKMGVGQLDLYILTPVQNSQDYQTFMRDWPDVASPRDLSLATLSSASALLVWHPACPREKVVRVLFPGVTPQAELLRGLRKLGNLDFLRKPEPTAGEPQGAGDGGKSKRGTRRDDGAALREKDTPAKVGKEAKNNAKGLALERKEVKRIKKPSESVVSRNGVGKKETPVSGAKKENKSKVKKDAKDESKTLSKKTKKVPGKDAKKVEVKKAEVKNHEVKVEESTPPVPPKTMTTPEDKTTAPLQETEKVKVDPSEEEPVVKKSAKVVGFPSPLKAPPKTGASPDTDLTPTEYTLLDGALRASPPSRSSEERTVERNSGPNSAGHTPYCLSPDDVWGERDALGRLRAREEDPKTKSLGFLPLGSLKEGVSDPSPSAANTTTSTHSMVAEVSSPQSTEVDESLSTSLEHWPVSGGQREAGLPGNKKPRLPPAPRLETASHDVDLCLVSPCEFKHFKVTDGSGESNAAVCTEECPSTTADVVLDSDEEEESCGLPSRDPPPGPLKDSPPLSPPHDSTMPVPQSDVGAREKKIKTGGVRGKTSTVTPTPPKPRPGNVTAKATPVVGRPSKWAPSPSSRRPSSSEETTIFVDLAYVPSGASSSTVGVDFFKSVRSSCYVVSGHCPEREGLMRQTLDALLQAKASWEHSVQVTLIPTFESASMQDWYQETVERQRELGVLVLGSNSTVAMQDDTFPACKIEF
ncbi:microtubule-associated protein 1S-like [Stigmatopora nigra]